MLSHRCIGQLYRLNDILGMVLETSNKIKLFPILFLDGLIMLALSNITSRTSYCQLKRQKKLFV